MLQEFRDYFLKLAYHKKLNPKLFDGDKLKPVVRDKLIEIGDAWMKFAKIPLDAIEDVICTGGNMNYNYTEESDIDVHVVVDLDKFPIQDKEILRDYIFAKKNLWAKAHSNRVLGYPVELFAQSKDDRIPNHQGVYSILYDDWIVKPENLKLSYDDRNLHEKVLYEQADIDRIIRNADYEAAKAKQDRLKGGRGLALATPDGEFAAENLVFKSLRNTGHLTRLSDFVRQKEDEALSL